MSFAIELEQLVDIGELLAAETARALARRREIQALKKSRPIAVRLGIRRDDFFASSASSSGADNIARADHAAEWRNQNPAANDENMPPGFISDEADSNRKMRRQTHYRGCSRQFIRYFADAGTHTTSQLVSCDTFFLKSFSPTLFTARAYARAVLGVVILSVCPSVCLSHAWIVTKLNDALRIF